MPTKKQSRQKRRSGPKPPNAWMQFLANYRKAHPKVSLRDAMICASKEYRKH